MGAVRDCSEEETVSLILAAKSLNIVCVGANLGRTAEFTSKIVTAFNAHAAANVLARAVIALPEMGDSAPLKLVPMRAGEWSWDGEKNFFSKKRKISSVSEISSSTIAVHHFSVVAFLIMTPDEICVDLEHREKMLGIVQIIVSTLWRSRLVSENNQDCASNSPEAVVVPILYLFFSDDSFAKLTQSKIAFAMGESHMAAPSEFQVLSMLIGLINDSSVFCRPKSNTSPYSLLQNRMESILSSYFSGEGRQSMKHVKIVELIGTSLISTKLKKEKIEQPQIVLSDFAYEKNCGCSSSISSGRK
jgi:hypothetical protein